MNLRGTQTSLNGFADLLAFPGLRIATNIDADHPHSWFAADNLAVLTGQVLPPEKQEERHTCGTHGRCFGLVLLGV
jgi:hypothetical protein